MMATETEVANTDVILAELKESDRKVQALREEIAERKEAIELETQKALQLARQLGDEERIARVKQEIEGGKRSGPGRRSVHNPVKNLNIGVRRSYEWQKMLGYSAEDARKRVYISASKKAASHGKITWMDKSGRRVEAPLDEATGLPVKVVEKIEQCYREYDQITLNRKKPKVKPDKTTHASM